MESSEKEEESLAAAMRGGDEGKMARKTEDWLPRPRREEEEKLDVAVASSEWVKMRWR